MRVDGHRSPLSPQPIFYVGGGHLFSPCPPGFPVSSEKPVDLWRGGEGQLDTPHGLAGVTDAGVVKGLVVGGLQPRQLASEKEKVGGGLRDQ